MARILLMSIGYRGDMEPFLALGQEMMQRGDTVAFCMPAQFKSLAKEVSHLFYEQDSRLIDLITRISCSFPNLVNFQNEKARTGLFKM